MLSREDLLKSKEYWLTVIQNQLFNHIEEYMKEEGLNRTSLAEKLGVTKGYVSQVLNGDSDHRLSKYIELLIATNKVPVMHLEDLDNEVQKQMRAFTVTNEFNYLKPTPFISISYGEGLPITVSSNTSGELKIAI